MSTTFVIFGTSLFISLLLFVIDERGRRNIKRTEAYKWFNLDTDKEAEIFKEYPYEHEIGFKLIFKKLPNTRILGKFSAPIFIFVVIPYFLLFFASIADGTLMHAGNEPGFLKVYTQILILVTVAVSFYLFRGVIENVPRGFSRIGQARKNRTKTIVEQELKEIAQYLMRTHESREGKKWKIDRSMLIPTSIGGKARMVDLIILALLVMLGFIIILGYVLSTPEIQWYGSSDNYWTHLVFVAYYTILVTYFIRILLCYVVRLILSMQSIGFKLSAKNVLRVQPVHPDKAGGLGEFGKLAWRIDVLLIPFIIIQLVWFLAIREVTPILIITMVIGISLIPIFFFIPLRGLNGAMKEAKRQEMDKLSKQFHKNYWKVRDCLDRKKGISREVEQQAREDLERVILLYDRAEQMPVWPFDRNTIEKVSVTVIVPLVIVIIQYFTSELVD